MIEVHQAVADSIRNGIESFAVKNYDDGFRNHLGASLIGHDCERFLWFTFRWAYHHVHTGRMYRLFNTGHCEELRIIDWLNNSGHVVKNIDPATGKQYRISGINGHFGGSIDGVTEIKDFGDCLLECKTSKTGSEFKAFFENGVQVNKPQHYKQCCTYGNSLGFKHCLYICKNKDNDDLYIEFFALDWNKGKLMEAKAEKVIYSEVPPHRISESSAFWKCKGCDFVGICHQNKPIQKNCRSCKHAHPVEDAQWACFKFGMNIPSDFIPSGCDSWEGIC